MKNNRVTFSPPPPRSTRTSFKDGANLLFRGLIIANTNASSMSSWVSYRFQIDSSYTCGWAKTMRKSFEWTRIFLKTERKSCVFKRIRIRVDRAYIAFSHSRTTKAADSKAFTCKLLDNTSNSKGLITEAGKAMRSNSVLSAVLSCFSLGSFAGPPVKRDFTLKIAPGNPTSQYRDSN